jgi:uncharacterized protein (DUF433 family)
LAQVVDDSKAAVATDERLRAAERMVVSTHGVMGGEPCIAGTRVPVYMISALAAEVGVEETLETYLFLGRERIELALVYAAAHPGVYVQDVSALRKLKQKGRTRYVTVKRVDV